MIDVWNIAVITLAGATFNYVLTDSRLPALHSLILYYGVIAAGLGIEAALVSAFGVERAMTVYTLMLHVPAFLLSLYLGRVRGWQLVFQVMSCVYFSQLTMQLGAIALALTGLRPVQFAIYMTASVAIIAAELKWFKPVFTQMFTQIQKGWWLPCLVLIVYYTIGAYVLANDEWTNLVIRPSLALLMLGFYGLIILLLTTLQRQMAAQYRVDMLAMQTQALRSRMEAVRAAEDAIRVERHDLRHRLQTARELVLQDSRQKALELLDDAESRLNEIKPVRWCPPPVLDAVFSSYFDQAERCGIEVKAGIALNSELPVDEAEFAIVMANVLDNAIQACMQLSEPEREINCKVIAHPSLMVEVQNPVKEPVAFDGMGRPVSGREGHGVGTQSVAAFCKRYGAICRYECTQGRFTFRLVI